MCSLQRNYDVIRNWERFETGPLTVYHLRAHHKIEYTAQSNTNFYTFISASGTPSSRKK